MGVGSDLQVSSKGWPLFALCLNLLEWHTCMGAVWFQCWVEVVDLTMLAHGMK